MGGHDPVESGMLESMTGSGNHPDMRKGIGGIWVDVEQGVQPVIIPPKVPYKSFYVKNCLENCLGTGYIVEGRVECGSSEGNDDRSREVLRLSDETDFSGRISMLMNKSIRNQARRKKDSSPS
jgi:hypothetical protein